jgi:hypothetical protein
MSVIQGGEHEEPPQGGLDPEVPQVLTTWQVVGPVLIGHTADFNDLDAPIAVHQQPVLPGADGVGMAEGRCPACIAHPFIARGEDRTLLVLEHEPGCLALARWLRLARVPR